jgi:hypothetical protein
MCACYVALIISFEQIQVHEHEDPWGLGLWVEVRARGLHLLSAEIQSVHGLYVSILSIDFSERNIMDRRIW